jgi:hypothetical protein
MYLKGSFYILRFLFSNKPIIEIWFLTPKKILKFWLIWRILFMKKSDFSSQQNLQNKSLIYTKCWGSWYLIVSVFEFCFVLVEMCFQHSLMYRKIQYIYYSFSFSLKNSPFLFLIYYKCDGLLLPCFPWNNGTKLFSFGVM